MTKKEKLTVKTVEQIAKIKKAIDKLKISDYAKKKSVEALLSLDLPLSDEEIQHITKARKDLYNHEFQLGRLDNSALARLRDSLAELQDPITKETRILNI